MADVISIANIVSIADTVSIANTVSKDMQNFMSVQSAACVHFQGLGKLSALSIRCFVVKLLLVTIMRSFQCNMVGEVRFEWDSWG